MATLVVHLAETLELQVQLPAMSKSTCVFLNHKFLIDESKAQSQMLDAVAGHLTRHGGIESSYFITSEIRLARISQCMMLII